MSGYAHSGYAVSLAEFGTPRPLPLSGGQVLIRDLPGAPGKDGMGCYPLFACRDWSALASDLASLGDELICVSLVTDPFGGYDEDLLRRCFPDVMFAFKEHFVTDLSRSPTEIVSRHHRYYATRAAKQVGVEIVADPPQFLDEWEKLYAGLIVRYQLKGIKAFSRQAFAAQLGLPGLTAFRAVHRGETVAAHLWYEQDDVAYSHLAACTPAGYELFAAYALHWHALEYFAGRVQWLDLGAGAGNGPQKGGGLTFFKSGWSTGTRTAYFCGRVLDAQGYAAVSAASVSPTDGYFPAYRRGEFD